MKLTSKMKETLLVIGYGVTATVDGYISDDDPTVRVNLHSAEALRKRGLTGTHCGASSGLATSTISLTEEGWKVFYALEEEEAKREDHRRLHGW